MPRHAPVLVGSLVGFDPPLLPAGPVDPARTTLYTADELYDAVLAGQGYEDGLDARAYAWSQRPRTPGESMLRALHDHAMDEALARFVVGRRLVGVMGGHALARGSDGVRRGGPTRHDLATTYTVATGGGPGAMEAANLGRAAPRSTPRRWRPTSPRWRRCPATPTTRPCGPGPPSTSRWRSAMRPPRTSASRRGTTGTSPPTCSRPRSPSTSATRRARRSCSRSATPGSSSCPAPREPCRRSSRTRARTTTPTVLGRADGAGRRATTGPRTLPVWPLLKALAAGRHMEDRVHLVDTAAEAAALLS